MDYEIIEQVKKHFYESFKTKSLTIASPGRINLIGEHIDYNNGFVLPAAINKYIYASISKATGEECTVIALDCQEHYSFGLNDIQPIPNGGWRNYVIGVVAELQKAGYQLHPFNLVFAGDIPVGAGLSSSAALENSVVFGLNELFQLGLTKMDMIFISQKAEHHYAGVKCGIMDQFASMFGDEKHALFLDCQTMEYEWVPLDLGDYRLLLFNTNVQHNLADSAYNQRRATCERAVKKLKTVYPNIQSLRDALDLDKETLKDLLSDLEYLRSSYVLEEMNRVLLAKEALKNKNFLHFGKLLYETHYGLECLYEVSCIELDSIVAKAKTNFLHIRGARMMGGGFGGCVLGLIYKDGVEAFCNLMKVNYFKTFKTALDIYTVQLSNGTQLI